MTRILLRPTEKRDYWEVYENYEFIQFVIPAGFRTDGASIPWLFRGILPKMRTDYLEPAVLHDYLLRQRKNGKLNMTREAIDDHFRIALSVSNTKPFLKNILFFSVKLYGILAEGPNYWK